MKMINKALCFFFTCFTLISSCTLLAQQADGRYTDKKLLPFGVAELIESAALSETRLLNIYLPYGYHPDSTTRYPVIYLLDGSMHEDYPHIAGLAQFMNMYNLLPNSIIVGIANVDRYRDFTYPSKVKQDIKDIPTSGGSAKFISFVKNELQPFIDKHYPTNGQRTIIGQSLGGLLATEILLTQPELFDDYIIVSPSLWWDKQRLVNSAAAFFKSNQNLKKRIFISLGKEHPVMHETAEQLVAAIKSLGNENLTVFYEPILTENHATILHLAVYKAFEKLNPKAEKK